MKTSLFFAAVTSLLCAVNLRPAQASVPAGVWAKTRAITLLPNETNPTQIQIHGVFLTWSGTGPVGSIWDVPGYESAREGYMYFTCPAGQEALCRLAWTDLANSIGDSCRGFGAQDEPRGTVRDRAICPANPDVFPLGMGVSKGYRPCLELDKFAASDAGVTSCEAGTIDSGTQAKDGASPASDAEADDAATTDSAPGLTTSTGAGGEPDSGSAGSLAGSSTGGAPPAITAAPSDDGGCSVTVMRRPSYGSLALLGLAALTWAARRRRSGLA